MKQSFQAWVDNQGGISETSRFMEIPQQTISSWYHLERYPRPKQQELICEMSDDLVDFDKLRQDYLANKESSE